MKKPDPKPQEPKGEGGPGLRFKESSHDFGTLKKGSIARFTYVFTNTGNAPLKLEWVDACECSTVDWPRTREFKPGESGEIRLEYDTAKETETGAVKKTINVFSNTPKPLTEIYFQAVITP